MAFDGPHLIFLTRITVGARVKMFSWYETTFTVNVFHANILKNAAIEKEHLLSGIARIT